MRAHYESAGLSVPITMAGDKLVCPTVNVSQSAFRQFVDVPLSSEYVIPQFDWLLARQVHTAWYSEQASTVRGEYCYPPSVHLAVRFLTDLEVALAPPGGYPLATLEECIEEYDAHGDSAAGFPFKTQGFRLKEDVPIQLAYSLALSYADKPSPVCYAEFFKDELIKATKAAEGRYRIICCGPADFYVLGVMTSLHWHKRRTAMHRALPYKCGIDPYSHAWDALGREHEVFNTHYELDLKGAEFRFRVETFECIRLIWHAVVPIESRKHVDAYMYGLVNKLVVSQTGEVDLCPNLNPSGHYNTTVFTDLLTAMVIYGYLASIGLRLDFAGLNTVCAVSIYGDNALISVDDELKRLGFSASSFEKYASEFGVVLKLSETTDVCDMRFLSAGWREHYGVYQAFNEHYDKLLMSAVLTKFKAGAVDKHANKLVCISRLLLFGDDSVYEKFREIVRRFLVDYVDELKPCWWLLPLRFVANVSLHGQRLAAAGRQAGGFSPASLKSNMPLTKKSIRRHKVKFGPKTEAQARQATRRKQKKKVNKQKKRQRKPRGEVFTEAPARRGNVSMPIGAGGQFQIATHWPRTYVTGTHATKDGAGYKFCVPLCRYGVDTAATPGGAGMSFIGTTAKFAQLFALGPGVTYNQPGTSLKSYDNVSWLNALMSAYAQNWVEYRMKRLKVHVVPNNATTASARSYWMAFYEDPAIAMRDASTTAGAASPAPAVFDLTTIQSSGEALVFPAWQANSLNCRPRPHWLKVNQVFRDAADAGTTVLTWSAMESYLQEHSFGALACVCDYTNSGGAPILDGYIFLEGEVELRESAPLMVTTSAPLLAGQLSTVKTRNPVTPAVAPNELALLAQLRERLQGEMKTRGPVTTQGPQAVQAPEFRSIPPLSQLGMLLTAYSDAELLDIAALVTREHRQRELVEENDVAPSTLMRQ